MHFYSGFSLKDDISFFKEYIKVSDFNVTGFSYGAIKALLHVRDTKQRVDTLQLFSPAFFQTKPEKFRRLQMMAYKKDTQKYLDNFIKTSFHPYPIQETLHVKTTSQELHELLYYEWSMKSLKEIVNRGVEIEVYLGEKDAIIDADGAKKFFLEFATTYYIKGANHFLMTSPT